MSTQSPAIRILTPRDIPGAQRLRELAKWNQTDTDWRNLLSFEPKGCFAAEMDGKVVGTATTARYTPNSGPGSFGWVGMVLVDPDYRRHGIGSTLLKRCIQYLKDCGVETVKLDATPMGKLVYEKLGFVGEYELERWEGMARGEPTKIPDGVEISTFSPADLDALEKYDTPIFGAQRPNVLAAWSQSWPENALLARRSGKIVGYALARRGSNFDQIGPISGESPEISAALLARLLSQMNGRKVVVDLVTSNSWARATGAAHGLQHQRPFLRMAAGANSSPGTPGKMLAICCPELG
jgi:GNAT superfamily N-acetyltransferase